MWVRSVVGIEMILAHTVTSVAAEFFHVFFWKAEYNRNSASEQKFRDCCERVDYQGAQNGASLNPKALDYHNLNSLSQKSGALPQKLQSMFFVQVEIEDAWSNLQL